MATTVPTTGKLSIRDLRIERNLSLTLLGNELGVSPTTVLGWERKKMYPKPEALETLCKYFDVTPDQLDLAPFKKPGVPIGYQFNKD